MTGQGERGLKMASLLVSISGNWMMLLLFINSSGNAWALQGLFYSVAASWFIHSLVHRLLGCFHFALLLLDGDLGVKLLTHGVWLSLTFKESGSFSETGCTIFHFHHRHVIVPVPPHLQYLFGAVQFLLLWSLFWSYPPSLFQKFILGLPIFPHPPRS